MYSRTCYEQPPLRHWKVAFQDRWLSIGDSFVLEMSFWGMVKWPPIGGWLLIRVVAHNRFHCSNISLCIKCYCMYMYMLLYVFSLFLFSRFESCWPVIGRDANGVIFVYNPDQPNHDKELETWYDCCSKD